MIMLMGITITITKAVLMIFSYCNNGNVKWFGINYNFQYNNNHDNKNDIVNRDGIDTLYEGSQITYLQKFYSNDLNHFGLFTKWFIMDTVGADHFIPIIYVVVIPMARKIATCTCHYYHYSYCYHWYISYPSSVLSGIIIVIMSITIMAIYISMVRERSLIFHHNRYIKSWQYYLPLLLSLLCAFVCTGWGWGGRGSDINMLFRKKEKRICNYYFFLFPFSISQWWLNKPLI